MNAPVLLPCGKLGWRVCIQFTGGTARHGEMKARLRKGHVLAMQCDAGVMCVHVCQCVCRLATGGKSTATWWQQRHRLAAGCQPSAVGSLVSSRFPQYA
jgi:hypothetical protein